MRDGIEGVADAIIRRWSRERTLELHTAELTLVRAWLRDRGTAVHDLPDGRFEVETEGIRSACCAAELLLMGLRQLLVERRVSSRGSDA